MSENSEETKNSLGEETPQRDNPVILLLFALVFAALFYFADKLPALVFGKKIPAWSFLAGALAFVVGAVMASKDPQEHPEHDEEHTTTT